MEKSPQNSCLRVKSPLPHYTCNFMEVRAFCCCQAEFTTLTGAVNVTWWLFRELLCSNAYSHLWIAWVAWNWKKKVKNRAWNWTNSWKSETYIIFCFPFTELWGDYRNGLVCWSVHSVAVWLSVRHTLVVSVHFQTNLSGDWSQMWWIHSLHILLIFCHSQLNFLACDWLNSFFVFANKLLIRLGPNLVDQLIMGLPRPDFWSCSTDFLLFPDLWLVKQFLCICRQTIDRIDVKFGGPICSFAHTPPIFHPGLWLVKQLLCICRQTIDWI